MTRLLFRHGLELLAHCEVQRCSLDEVARWHTDAQGQLELELEPGIHWLKVLTPDQQWLYTVLQLDERVARLEINLQELKQHGQTQGKAEGQREHTSKVFASHQHLQRHLLSLQDRFELHEILGRGGMGIVLRAKDLTLQRSVALKIKHNLTARSHNQAQTNLILLNEARRLARLHHPNLIAIYDVLTLEDDLILITEFVDGISLDQHLRRHGPLSERALLRAAIQLVRALRYLHEQGYVHRDLKPANMMLERDGTLKLIDFGLASPMHELLDTPETRAKGALGTPGYMAPEQLIEGGLATVRTDIYQLGVTLYELATGQGPTSLAAGSYQPLDKMRPELSNELAYLVARCVDPHPERRWHSAAELLTRLQRLYARQNPHARPSRGDEAELTRQWTRVRRRPISRRQLLAYVPSIIAALIFAFTLGILFGRHAPNLP